MNLDKYFNKADALEKQAKKAKGAKKQALLDQAERIRGEGYTRMSKMADGLVGHQ